ncbi:MAG: hypothetical protein ACT4QA_00105 [Panacagrimonas sp.]
MKVGPGDRLYVGTQTFANAVREFSLAGSALRTFGADTYDGVAVLPGDILWAGGTEQPGRIDVFSLSSGLQTGSITLDNGQGIAGSMYYSAATDTVLMADYLTGQVFERTTTGAFVRVFSAPGGLGNTYAVTRGVNGDVYATSFDFNSVYRWTAAGGFVSQTTLAELGGLIGIISVPVPLDFGDAPDPTYLTLLASNGARHALSSSLRLGPTIDSEAEGQPNSGATGDDLAGVDDEDGVSFVGTLIAGAFRGFVVNVAGGPG